MTIRACRIAFPTELYSGTDEFIKGPRRGGDGAQSCVKLTDQSVNGLAVDRSVRPPEAFAKTLRSEGLVGQFPVTRSVADEARPPANRGSVGGDEEFLTFPFTSSDSGGRSCVTPSTMKYRSVILIEAILEFKS